MCQCHDPVYLDIERLAVNYMISIRANYDIYMYYSERPPPLIPVNTFSPYLTPVHTLV